MVLPVSSFVAFDLETTGLDPDRDRIIQVGAVRFVGGVPVAEFQQLVNPGCSVPLRVQRLTGLDEGTLATAPREVEVLPALLAFIADSPVVAHNADFDRTFLEAALGRAGLAGSGVPFWDTVELGRILHPLLGNHRLGTLRDALGVEREAEHRALEDARAAGGIFLGLLARLREIATPLLRVMVDLIRPVDGRNWALQELFLAALAGREPGFGLEAGGFAGSAPLEFDSAGALELALHAQDYARGEENPAADAEGGPVGFSDLAALEGLLAQEGPLSRELPTFELRSGQRRMLQLVAEALAGDRHLMVEAGTGTGKSLAYLLPAAVWALDTGEKVVIATNTINLQEQLWEKDLPLVRRVGLPLRAAMVKGRGNYFCLLRWEELFPGRGQYLGDEERRFFLRILGWLRLTTTGDRSELNLFGSQEELWQELCADDSCPGRRCRWYDDCYLFRSRREAEAAQVLIVNHSLLFSDIKAENHVLPAYRYLVCDEAHHLEEVATRQLSLEVGERQLTGLLDALSPVRRHGYPGTLGILERHLRQAADVQRILQDARAASFSVRGAAAELFRLMAELPVPAGGTESDGGICRIDARVRQGPNWAAVAAAGGELRRVVGELEGLLQQILTPLRAEDPLAPSWPRGIATELERQARGLAAVSEALGFILDGDDENYVCWAEWEERQGKPRRCLRAAPVLVGPLLESLLFSQLRSVILTSATLTVKGSFRYAQERLGLSTLPAERLAAEVVDSPFDYPRQALLCVPADFPLPSGEGTFVRATAEFILQLVRVTGGRTLVLFTSHRMLREVYGLLRDPLEGLGLCLLGQGLDGGRTQLKEEFEANPETVLFGSASFWEGVDIPGEALSCVVMVRLPFGPPNLPIVEARGEELAARGLNPFYNFLLPEAIIRFRQGFGRLIRRTDDRGAVVVLDPRLVLQQGSRYGRHFIDSLPGPRFFAGTAAEVWEELALWFRSRAGIVGGKK